MNVQYAVKGGEVFVLEVNPRASRTVPFVSKAIGRPLAKLAALVMIGKTLDELGFTEQIWPKHFCVKESVFPFVKFPGVDVLLGPEMRSTGEVMGIDSDFGRAYAKAQIEAGNSLPTRGRVLVSVRGEDRPRIAEAVAELARIGFEVMATPGTAESLAGVRRARGKRAEGRSRVAQRARSHLGRVMWILWSTRSARIPIPCGTDSRCGVQPFSADFRTSRRPPRREPQQAQLKRFASSRSACVRSKKFIPHRRGPHSRAVSTSPFAAAVEAVYKPIAFAVQDDFAHADRVHGLEAAVRRAAERALALQIPRDARRALEAVRELFAEHSVSGGASHRGAEGARHCSRLSGRPDSPSPCARAPSYGLCRASARNAPMRSPVEDCARFPICSCTFPRATTTAARSNP